MGIDRYWDIGRKSQSIILFWGSDPVFIIQSDLAEIDSLVLFDFFEKVDSKVRLSVMLS